MSTSGRQSLRFQPPGYRAPGWDAWLRARLAIENLPVAWPTCDDRCASVPHDPHLRLALADLEIERTQARGGAWWDRAQEVEIERDPEWLALGPAIDATPTETRLPRLTQLAFLATTDDAWDAIFNPGTPVFEDLYAILDGPFAGGQLVAVRFGPSDISAGLAGKLIVPDHPPARDPAATDLRLADAVPALDDVLDGT